MVTAEKKHSTQIYDAPKMVCKDHLVTGEEFQISEYENGILRTEPVPTNPGKYYESDNYISHNDSTTSLQDKVYQIVKSHMLSKKAKWVRRYFKQGDILDFGAGTGEFLNKMKKFLWNVDGVELNRTARDLGIIKGLNLKPDLSELRIKKFDVVSLWHVLEHLPDFEKKIQQFYDLLKKDGILIVAVPNYRSYDAEYYKEDWAAWDVPRHLWHFSREGLSEKLAEFNFKLIEEKPLKFDSYYVSLLSEKHRNASTNPFNAFYRGFISNQKAKKTGEYSSITYFFKKTSET